MIDTPTPPTRRRASDGNDGFTLIELLIVIVVLGILAAVVVFSLGGVATSASVAACQSDVKTIETAIAAYNAQTGGTPVVTTSLLTSGSHPYVTSWSSNSGYTITLSGGTLYVQTPSDASPVLASQSGSCAGAGGSSSTTSSTTTSSTTTTTVASLLPIGTDASSSGANAGTLQGAAVASTTGPFSAGSLSLPGTSGSYMETTTQVTTPSTFSLVAWFKTTSPGAIMGFTNSRSDAPASNYDRMVWIDGAGKLVFGVWPYTVSEVTSPQSYNDGHWHFVVATWGSGGQSLYVDGSLVAHVASSPVYTYTGYWHIGFAYFPSWPDAPSSNYFLGNLADVAIIPSELSAQSVTTLNSAPSSSAESQAMLALNPSAFWPLNG